MSKEEETTNKERDTLRKKVAVTLVEELGRIEGLLKDLALQFPKGLELTPPEVNIVDLGKMRDEFKGLRYRIRTELLKYSTYLPNLKVLEADDLVSTVETVEFHFDSAESLCRRLADQCKPKAEG